MALSDLLNKLARYRHRKRVHSQIEAARDLLNGPDAWYVLEKLNVPGFGTDLVRIDFPPRIDAVAAVRRDAGCPSPLDALVGRTLPAARRRLEALMAHAPPRGAWP